VTVSDNRQLAGFTKMQDGNAEDWAVIGAEYFTFAEALPNRILAHLKLLSGDYGGFPVDRLEHSLQTATLAHQAGENEEYVVCGMWYVVCGMCAVARYRRYPRKL
jgi:predicted HD phosphohydrolase